MSNSKSEDTSLDAQLRVSINNIMIEFLGMEGKPTMDEAIHRTKLKLLELFKSKQAKLLQVIEDELDKDIGIHYRDEEDKFAEGWGQRLAYVRAIVMKIKERYENNNLN